ncbi:MAG: hypothetical protein AAFN51_12810 [Pseudomonadota bacterium]
MVRLYLLPVGILLAACTDPTFREPIQPLQHGAAVRANMAAHIIDPNPPARKPPLTDAQRPVLALENYRTNEVETPGEEQPKSLTGAGE